MPIIQSSRSIIRSMDVVFHVKHESIENYVLIGCMICERGSPNAPELNQNDQEWCILEHKQGNQSSLNKQTNTFLLVIQCVPKIVFLHTHEWVSNVWHLMLYASQFNYRKCKYVVLHPIHVYICECLRSFELRRGWRTIYF